MSLVKVRDAAGKYSDKDFLLAISFDLVLTACCVSFYFGATNLTTMRFLVWAETLNESIGDGPNPLKEPLPDLYLDFISPKVPASAAKWLSDGFAGAMFVGGLGLCFLSRFPDLFNLGCVALCCSTLGKCVAETITTLPGAAGYAWCVKSKLGLESTETDASKMLSFRFNPSGSCSDMMWSGHTCNALLGSYLIYSCLERLYPAFRKSLCGTVRVRTLVAGSVGILQGNMALLNRMHYSVDVFVALLIMTLLLSNDKFRYFVARLNPFLRNGWVMTTRVEKAKDFDTVMQTLEEHYPDVAEAMQTRLRGEHCKRRRTVCEEQQSFIDAV